MGHDLLATIDKYYDNSLNVSAVNDITDGAEPR